MKIKRNYKKNKSIVLAIILAALVLFTVSISVYAFVTSNNSSSDVSTEPANQTDNQVDLSPATNEQIQTGNKAKEDFINRTDETNSSKASISISSYGKNEEAGAYQIRTIITGADDTGSCKLTFKSENFTKIYDAPTQKLGTYDVCQGFDIPLAELETGESTIIIVYSGSAGATATTKQDVKN